MFTAAAFIIAKKCTTSRPSTDKWIKKLDIPTRRNIRPREGTKYWRTHYNVEEPHTHAQWKNTDTKDHIFHDSLYKTQNRQVHTDRQGMSDCQGLGEGRQRAARAWECPKTDEWWLHNSVNILKIAELFTLNGLTLGMLIIAQWNCLHKKSIRITFSVWISILTHHL